MAWPTWDTIQRHRRVLALYLVHPQTGGGSPPRFIFRGRAGGVQVQRRRGWWAIPPLGGAGVAIHRCLSNRLPRCIPTIPSRQPRRPVLATASPRPVPYRRAHVAAAAMSRRRASNHHSASSRRHVAAGVYRVLSLPSAGSSSYSCAPWVSLPPAPCVNHNKMNQ
jgi:hypothetical protein